MISAVSGRRALAICVRVVQGLALLTGGCFLLGVLGQSFWVFDLFSHFRAQYCLAFLVCGVVLLVLRRRRSGSVSLVAGVMLTMTLLPARVGSASLPDSAEIKLVSFNVLKTNSQREEICRFLEREQADVIFLTEVTAAWKDDIVRLRETYPFKVSSPREKNHGIVLLSRHPFLQEKLHLTGNRPWAEARIQKEGTSFHIAALHTVLPLGLESSRARNDQLVEIAAYLADKPRAILCGDLNVTPYSPWFQEMLRKGQLSDTSRSDGFSPTWMRNFPLLTIPIDHVLLSQDLVLVDRQVGPSLGSDHSPLIVKIAARSEAGLREAMK